MNSPAPNLWLTVVLPISLLAIASTLFTWLWIKRSNKKWARPLWETKPGPHPEIVAAGRQLCDDGEFARDIVKRTPASLYGDAVELSCGHQTELPRSYTDTRTSCHKCASEWIEQQSALEAKRK